MKKMITTQTQNIEKDFDDCCSSIKPCSGDLEKLAVGIEELYN
jgi:hypothetical protein